MNFTAEEIDENRDKSESIEIISYESPEEIFAQFWRQPLGELKQCSFGGEDENGEPVAERSFDSIVDGMKEEGFWGFASHGDKTIHIWVSEKADMEDLIRLLAHERGHLLRPQHRDDYKEEYKAFQYEQNAHFAYCAAKEILKDKGSVE